MSTPFEAVRLSLTSLASRGLAEWWLVGLVLLGAVAAAALVGWLRRSVWEYGWNTNPPAHGLAAQVWCGLAFLALTAAILLGWAFYTAPLALDQAIGGVRAQLLPDARRGVGDGGWRRAVFRQAADEIQARGLEDFAGKPTPAQGSTEIPVTKPETAKLIAERYARAFDERFRRGEFGGAALPWGGWLAAKAPPISDVPALVPPSRVITADVAQNALLRTALERRLEDHSAALRAEVQRVGAGGFWFILGLVAILQGAAFAATGQAAYRDLRLDF